MKNKFYFLVSFHLLLTSQFGVAQQSGPSQEFDAIVGLYNTDLSIGVEYIEQHVIRNNQHKFFQQQNFESGSVTYAGQTYLNIPIKYNVYDDLLLVRLQNPGGEFSIQLHKELVESFRLDEQRFINVTSKSSNGEQIEGFYEILLELPSMLLLKKHVKKIRKHLDRNFTYYEFKPDTPQYILKQGDDLYILDSRRDLIRRFPEEEKFIRRHYRSNKKLSKTDQDTFLANLLRNLARNPSHELNSLKD